MTIVQLEYLMEVIHQGSFSAAAERCFVTQPSLSTQIKNLEEELGVTLLDRSHKPIILTDAGKIIVERVQQLLMDYQAVYDDVEQVRGVVAGELRLGVIPTIAPYLLPVLVNDFEKRCPNVELKIRELTTPEILRLMGRDELDAAILAGGTCPEGITEDELFDDRFYIYISPTHPLAERSNIRVEDVELSQMLLLADGHCLRNQVLELCRRQGRDHDHASYYFESGSLETLMRIVDRTEFMTIIPRMALEYIPADRRTQVKTLARCAVSRKVALATRRTYVKERVIAALRESILSVSPLISD